MGLSRDDRPSIYYMPTEGRLCTVVFKYIYKEWRKPLIINKTIFASHIKSPCNLVQVGVYKEGTQDTQRKQKGTKGVKYEK